MPACLLTRAHAGAVLFGAAALSCLALAPAAQAAEPASEAPAPGLVDLPLEALMNVEVVSASKFRQSSLEAPAAVTVVTADDIRAHGYRTLSELLRSVRGFHVSYDRNYEHVGVRGMLAPGDYSSRVLVLVDGLRTNDPVYNASATGDDFVLDMSLVDRVEVVRGPGSSVYGSSAYFAVVNVITKPTSALGGLQVSALGESFGTSSFRATLGRTTPGGVSAVLSASRFHREGRDLYFREFDSPQTNNGLVSGLDTTTTTRLFGRLGYKGVTVTAMRSDRERGLPAAHYGVAFGDPRDRWNDVLDLVDATAGHDLGGGWSADGRLFYGHYGSRGDMPFGPGQPTLHTLANGKWWGGELKTTGQVGRHKLIAGAEFQDNLRVDQISRDLYVPSRIYQDDRRSSTVLGLYAQDEVALTSGLRLNLGLRYDRYSAVGGVVNPRAALIWNPDARTTLRAFYGTAFRAPNAYELYYDDGAAYKAASQALEPEKIQTYELVLDRALGPYHLTASAYMNKLRDLISQIIDPADGRLVFGNEGGTRTRGVELLVERGWANGAKVRASYARQVSYDRATGLGLADSPEHLVKANAIAPVFRDKARLGVEAQYASGRLTLSGGSVAPYLVTNLTVTTDRLLPGGVSLSAGVWNLFDTRYADPAGRDLRQDAIPQDGRSVRVALSRTF